MSPTSYQTAPPRGGEIEGNGRSRERQPRPERWQGHSVAAGGRQTTSTVLRTGDGQFVCSVAAGGRQATSTVLRTGGGPAPDDRVAGQAERVVSGEAVVSG